MDELRDIFIVGTGTSLDGFDFNLLRDRQTIALNHALRHVPNADWWVASDRRVTAEYAEYSFGATPVLHCQRRSDSELARVSWYWRAAFYDLVIDPAQMLSRPRSLYQVSTVATAALSLAWRLGARRVYLLGVDGYSLGIHKYFYDNELPGDYQVSGSHKSHAQALARLAGWFNTQDSSPTVVLLSPDSPIDFVERRPLSSCLGPGCVVQPTGTE